MKAWALATSLMPGAAVFTVGALLLNQMDAITTSIQKVPKQQTTPSQQAETIIILVPSPSPSVRQRFEQTPSSVAQGKQETPIRP